jgi:hypothetical protein
MRPTQGCLVRGLKVCLAAVAMAAIALCAVAPAHAEQALGEHARGQQTRVAQLVVQHAGAEHVAMPFACALDHGRLALSPAPGRSYATAGSHDTRSVMICGQGAFGRCRTVELHRFLVSCDGGAVPWARIVAASGRLGPGRTAMDADRLVVPIRALVDGSVRTCPQRLPEQGKWAGRDDLASRNCEAAGPTAGLVALPAGFAPLREIGARLEHQAASKVQAAGATTSAVAMSTPIVVPIKSPVAPLREAVSDEPRATAEAPSVGSPESDAGRPALMSQSLTPPAPADNPIETAAIPASSAASILSAASSRATSVAAEPPPSASPPPAATAPPTPGPAAMSLVGLPPALQSEVVALASLLAAALGSLVTAAWLVMSGAPSAYRQRSAAKPPGGLLALISPGASLENAMAVNSQAAITALIAQAHEAIGALVAAAPLRDVLESELDIVRQRLAVVAAADPGGKDDKRRVASVYRVLVRDCERIRRIADSALASFSAPRNHLEPPQTKGEAYTLLGVNPDVSETVLKRLVDALRMSWHPDHARDEPDRLVREARVTQINVAWDLICGKREAA